jgi:sugar phosphate isomerase/epimerase
MKNNRRNFLKMASMGVIGANLPKATNAFFEPGIYPAKLSVQLYTVRDAFIKDIPGTLKKIADIGFKYVETAFWPDGVSIEKASQYINDAGLLVSSSHIEIPIGAQKQIMLDTANAFGSTKMIWHGWPEDKRYSSLAGTKELIAIYNEASKFASGNGLQFGLHNHWWEYRNKVGGKLVYEILLEELDPAIFLEMDTYWVKVAGHNPAAIITKLGKRAKFLHIKDGPALYNDKLAIDNPDPMTPVGKGTQNFPAIIKAANGNPDFLVIEMDKTAIDVFVALKESFDYMINNKLAIVG